MQRIRLSEKVEFSRIIQGLATDGFGMSPPRKPQGRSKDASSAASRPLTPQNAMAMAPAKKRWDKPSSWFHAIVPNTKS